MRHVICPIARVIRFTTQKPAQGDALIRLDGRLDAESTTQLQSLVADLDSMPGLTLDLSGLLSLDPHARAYLIQLRAAGVKLSGGSLYVTHMLQEG